MIQAHLKLGRIFGIEIGLHFSWFIIALLIVLSLGAYFESTQSDWGGDVVWISAVVTALLFFASLLLHELSHAAVALARGLPVASITLFALGGVAHIKQEAADAKTEFWVAIAGPIASAAIGIACLAAAVVLGFRTGMERVAPPPAVLGWLGYINISLAVFNLIPGFPLDGGRVLRAGLWWMTGDVSRATRWAAAAGQFVAAAFILVGLVRFLQGEGLAGLWIAFIGWFLLNAAVDTHRESAMRERLRGIRARDVMMRVCTQVRVGTTLQAFVEQLLRTGDRCSIVVGGGGAAGLITPRDVRSIPRDRWPIVTVEAVMRPIDRRSVVSTDTPLSDSLEAMMREDVHQLPVVEEGRLEGIVSRGTILRFLKTRAELNS